MEVKAFSKVPGGGAACGVRCLMPAVAEEGGSVDRQRPRRAHTIKQKYQRGVLMLGGHCTRSWSSTQASVAISKYNAVSLKRGHTCHDVEQFLLEYEDASTEMIRVGQLRTHDYHSVQREILDIQSKLWGTALLGWLKSKT